jgi:platelet-activating factor acetylhydrolase
MPSVTHQIFEYALLLALGSVVLLDRYAPQDLLLTPAQLVYHKLAAYALLAALLVLHHWRKELLPAYVALALRVASLVAASPTATALLEAPFPHNVWVERISVVGVMLSALVAFIFPLPDLAVLYGKHQHIGCRAMRLGGVDCRVFYPAAATRGSPVAVTKRVPYIHHGAHLAKGLRDFSNVPEWCFNNLSNAFLAAVADAPVAEKPAGGFPLAIFSHGLGGSLELYAFVNQQLASAGNVVVVVNHSDGSACVTRPEDDRIEYYQQITDAVRHNIDGEGYRFRNAQLRTRVQEVRRVLNAVSELKTQEQSDKSLWASINLQRVHAVGHSFGAATALTATHLDDRFGATVLLDAWMEPLDDSVRDGFGNRAPVLHLVSDPFAEWTPNAESVKRHARGCSHPLTRVKRIVGTRHNNFSDLPLFSPLINRLVKTSGSIDPVYALRMVSQLSATFLVDQCDAAVEKYPEVVELDSETKQTK